MLTYILRRLLLLVPTLLGVCAVVFFVMAWAPGGFGGLLLNATEARTEGEEARRIRQYFMRRYGLDKPAVVQFGRWLNQVSPLGFKTSAQLEFDDPQREGARVVLEGAPGLRPALVPAALEVAIQLAAYQDIEPAAAAATLVAALADSGRALELVRVAGGRPDEAAVAALESAARSGPADMATALLSRLGTELAGRSRVLLGRPTAKWPDLGLSLRGRRVSALLAETVPITLLLNLITIPLIYSVAVLTGIYAARFRGRLFDTVSGFTLLALWSLPTIWVGVLLIGYLASKQYLHWFPTAGLHAVQAESMYFLPRLGPAGFEPGWLLDMLWHMVLPVACLTYGGFAVLAKLMRGSILENIALDYVRTARAKGLSDHDVLFRHVLRNSLLPLITVATAILPSLFAGSVVVENIFSIQGMGKLGVEAAFMKDREVVMGTTLLGGLLGLLSQLIRDIWYAVADPRVSYE